MKAVLLDRVGGTENLRFADAPEPRPAPGEILVRVRYCALNHLDIWVRNGIPAYKVLLPHILGCDISGEIAGGDFAKWGFEAGQPVVVCPGRSCFECEPCRSGNDNRCVKYGIIGADGGPGGYAEFVSVPARNVFPLPGKLSGEEAAAFPLTFLTAWHMLVSQAQLQKGQTVLVLGASSGVGVAAIQIAKARGAKVIASSRSKEKLAHAKQIGADETIESPPEGLQRRTLSVSGGGVDVVFEHVGPAVFDQAVKCLKPGGILTTCGATSGPKAELDLRYIFSRELRIHGAKMGTLQEFKDLLPLVASGTIKPVVDKVFPLAEARQAQEYLARGNHFGKVVLKI